MGRMADCAAVCFSLLLCYKILSGTFTPVKGQLGTVNRVRICTYILSTKSEYGRYETLQNEYHYVLNWYDIYTFVIEISLE